MQLLRHQYHKNQPIEANYYPMPTTAILDDSKRRLTMLTREAHGCTSMNDGVLEVMLDRILIMDDGKGLGSDSLVRDNLPVRSQFVLNMEHRQRRTVQVAW